jgi:hypothetical protein
MGSASPESFFIKTRSCSIMRFSTRSSDLREGTRRAECITGGNSRPDGKWSRKKD